MERAPYRKQPERIPGAFAFINYTRIQRHRDRIGLIGACVPEFPVDQNRDRNQRCLAVRPELNHSDRARTGILLPRRPVLAGRDLRTLFLSHRNATEWRIRH